MAIKGSMNIKFAAKDQTEFFTTLRSRVQQYFKDNNISKYANGNMYIKSVLLMALYLVPYFLMITATVHQPLPFLGLWVLMGFGMSGVGFCIMHDANHGSYSRNKRLNHLLGHLINLIGGSAVNWKVQHNKLHHSYTNIEGMDEDIKTISILRFSPHQKKMKIHRLQHLYAWFFYGLMTISWITGKDFRAITKYTRRGWLDHKKIKLLFAKLIVSKAAYYTYTLILPLLLLPHSWWLIVIGFLVMHFTSGLLLGMVFQPAHVVPTSEFPLPDKKGKIQNNWAIHQLQTTSNFAPKSRIFSWFVGGLNYQIEHHLFPGICHIHYKALSTIVRRTALEFGLPYHIQPTFAIALANHTRMLRSLGR